MRGIQDMVPVLFLLVAVPNYAAMGNTVNGYLFNSYNTPSWPIIVANFCVVVHLAGAYAVFSAPFFNLVCCDTRHGSRRVCVGLHMCSVHMHLIYACA